MNFALRDGTRDDAETLAALSIQVFLDTYATEGVRPDLAQEAFTEYSIKAFAKRLRDRGRRFVVAEIGTGLVGFAEIVTKEGAAPIGGITGVRLERLYVQPGAQGAGVGKALVERAEQVAAQGASKAIWLIAWDRNERALAFYARRGYSDVGAGTYTFQEMTYGTRVLAKRLAGT